MADKASLRKRLLKQAGVSGMGKAKRTPSHKTKSHVVVANCNGKPKLIKTLNKEKRLKADTVKI